VDYILIFLWENSFFSKDDGNPRDSSTYSSTYVKSDLIAEAMCGDRGALEVKYPSMIHHLTCVEGLNISCAVV